MSHSLKLTYNWLIQQFQSFTGLVLKLCVNQATELQAAGPKVILSVLSGLYCYKTSVEENLVPTLGTTASVLSERLSTGFRSVLVWIFDHSSKSRSVRSDTDDGWPLTVSTLIHQKVILSGWAQALSTVTHGRGLQPLFLRVSVLQCLDATLLQHTKIKLLELTPPHVIKFCSCNAVNQWRILVLKWWSWRHGPCLVHWCSVMLELMGHFQSASAKSAKITAQRIPKWCSINISFHLTLRSHAKFLKINHKHLKPPSTTLYTWQNAFRKYLFLYKMKKSINTFTFSCNRIFQCLPSVLPQEKCLNLGVLKCQST